MTQPTDPRTALQLRSLVKANGDLEVSLATVPVPTPAANEVLIRIDAAPINPSDLGLLFAGADMATAARRGTQEDPVITATRSGGRAQRHGGALRRIHAGGQ